MSKPVASARPGAAKAWLAALVALLALLLAPGAAAQSFPAFTGLVVDAANILPADRKAALETKLQALQQETNHQFVVATIPDLQGRDIADYGYRLGRAWGVGLKDANNGAILIVAPNERKVRVEVGQGLEAVLTDALSSLIIQRAILPRFKDGDMVGGIEAGADQIAAQLRLPDDQARARAAAAAAEYDRTHRARGGGGFPAGLVVWGLIVGFVLLSVLRRGHKGARRYRRGNGDWPIWLWAASEIASDIARESRGGGGGFGGWGGGSDGGGGGWGGGGFTGGGGGGFGGGGSSGSW
ncbi:TPM domain-containing protein [Sphingomonas sp.]|uniref:TPM domain-containing protein n=1 Tax=Sphingomonas sp. TaxID=28214 RepID=UPI003B3BBA74